jgi:hypothetical protein
MQLSINERVALYIAEKQGEGHTDAYIMGGVASIKRDWRIVERARKELTGRVLQHFEDGLMVQDSRHAA